MTSTDQQAAEAVKASQQAHSEAVKASQRAARQPASQPASKPTAKGSKPKSAGSSKATVKPAAKGIVPAKVDAKGQPYRCQVIISRTSLQCENPARHQHSKGWSCSTHNLAALRGRAIFAGKPAPLKAAYVSPTQQALAALKGSKA